MRLFLISTWIENVYFKTSKSRVSALVCMWTWVRKQLRIYPWGHWACVLAFVQFTSSSFWVHVEWHVKEIILLQFSNLQLIFIHIWLWENFPFWSNKVLMTCPLSKWLLQNVVKAFFKWHSHEQYKACHSLTLSFRLAPLTKLSNIIAQFSQIWHNITQLTQNCYNVTHTTWPTQCDPHNMRKVSKTGKAT